MSLDLDYEPDQIALCDALEQFCRERCGDAVVRASSERFPRELWSELAGLGVLSAGAPGGEGGVLEIASIAEALGRYAFPGPLAETFLAMQVLASEERDAVADGRSIVSCGAPPLLPFAPLAGVFLEIDGDDLYRAEPEGPVEPVQVLGGEPWGRVALRRVEPARGAERALAIGAIALAAYVAALALRLVEQAAEHARTRRQFGRAIGDFQAVAHPLADCHMRLVAGRALARRAAWCLDRGEVSRAPRAAAAARLSCTAAAVEAAHVGHQVYGAIGITHEGPAFHLTRRIRQLASQAPGPAPAREKMLASLGLAAA